MMQITEPSVSISTPMDRLYLRMEPTKMYLYEPQSDITVYELALLLPMLMNPMVGATIEYTMKKHPEIKRHFVEG